VQLDGRLKLFVFLAGLFFTCLIVGDLIGGKLYQTEIGGHAVTISVGMIPFPIVFLLTDLINEFYGKRAARFVTTVGFVMAWLTIGVLVLAGQVPFAGFTSAADWSGVNQEAFDRVFGSSTRILMASTAAYLTAQLIDIFIFHLLKERTHGRFLWLRATGSTVVSQGIDTVVIQFLAWYGVMPVSDILSIIVTSYIVKVVIAIALTPAIYAGHALVERGLKLEPIDVG
jgi:queuosine precursor transporter